MVQNNKFTYRRSANAVVVSPSGKLLVLVGSKWHDRPDRSLQPDLVGGNIESDETIVQGLTREVSEETGLELAVDSVSLVFQNTYLSLHESEYWHNYYFLAESLSSDVTLSWEHSAFYWVDIAEFVTVNWRPSQRFIVDFMNANGTLKNFTEIHNNK